MKKIFKNDKKRRVVFWSILAMAIVVVTVLARVFYWYASNLLYKESISQLNEVSGQLFERLESQLDLQWDYLKKTQNSLEEKTSVTTSELQEIFTHYQTDLAPNGKKLKFRVVDKDGYYYTDEGIQGIWSGYDSLTNEKMQSFLINNWSDNENYMAFVKKANINFYVNGKKIEFFVLLRSMADMQEFFHSSVFKNKNIAYVIDSNGLILHKNGELDGVEYNGINIFSYLKNKKFPHISLNTMLKRCAKGEVICTDVKIDGSKFYVVYNQLPQFDWGIMLMVSSDDVAVGTAEMVNSIVSIFFAFLVIIIAVVVVVVLFMLKIQRDRVEIATKVRNERLLGEANFRLEQTNKELVNAQQKTEEALQVAKSATKAKSQFLANMSHDIRTPMNAIVGVTKLMEHEVTNPDKLTYYIDKLRHSGQYMLGLINDILDMSKIESGDVKLNLESVKIAEQVGQIESIIRSQCKEKNQEFNVIVHEISHEYIISDSIRLRQVFLNLLSNAVKYTPEGGKVRFELTELPCDKVGYATILTSVIDNGVGMSEDFQNRMFEPFARESKSTTNKIGGTGLGLSITKNIIDLMGGTITVKSQPNKGSQFDVLLTVPIDKDAPKIKFVQKLLLVTSEESLITNITASLKHESVELIVAKDIDKAQEILNSNTVQAILLSGYLDEKVLTQIVKKLRESAKDAMFIFCCDYAHKESVRDLIVASGVDGLITRPFFVENLILAIVHAQKDTPIEEKHSSLSGKHFLCAEDNELNAEILEALLNMHGATCVIYPNGAELVKAFESVKEGDFDAILMDVQMPVMNGMDATREIRMSNNPLGKTIPILAMTANAFSSDVLDCLNAGMDAHLPKPLDITALERTLQEILASRGGDA